MKKALSVVLVLIFLTCSGFVGYGQPQKTNSLHTNEKIAPIDRDTVVEKLISEGKLSANATQDEITMALKDYIGNASYEPEKSQMEKKKQAAIDNKIEKGLYEAEGKGIKLGNAKNNLLEPAVSIDYPNPVKTVKVLVLLGDFADLKYNSIPEPDSNDVYWTADFSKEHYQQLLFGDGYYTTPEGTKSPTFKQYFKEQSNGNLNIEGDVFGWFTADKDAVYYGADSDTSSNVNIKEFIIDIAKKAAAAGVDLSDYDIEDPYDYDGDGDLLEPDGIVDHLMVIHAGMGQEQGGGALGDDSIWSHSSSVPYTLIDAADGMYIYPYTTEAENGTVGLFAHEFVHDLGIPDDYDTIYSADGDIVEYWSIMGSGSWSGMPAGTMPSGINPYSRILLGLIHGGDWINWEYADFNTMEPGGKVLDTATMNTGNTQAVLIKLPQESNTIIMNTPAEGLKEFYGGTGSEIDNNMVINVDLTGKTSASLSYSIWYDIEENWDAGFVQVSEDGINWTSLSTPYTVDDFNNPEGYPTILDSLPAYTGSSGGWLSENIDLSAYAGKNIYIRYRYATDWAAEYYGMFVDNVVVTADGEAIISENAEDGFGAFTSNGFEISDGTRGGPHYYVAEWRSHLGVDEGLKYNGRANVEYNQGMALWYVNTIYTDNWVGLHPGYGCLGIVDSTQYVYFNAGLGSKSRSVYMPFIQLHDAAFSLDMAADMDLSVYSWAQITNLPGKQAQPLFDDSTSYFNVKSPYSGLKLPELGLKIRVTGNASDYSRGEIYISK